MGRYCHLCGHLRPDARFSGRGRHNHVCKNCAALPREVRERMEILQELEGLLYQSNISAGNKDRLQSLTAHPDPQVSRSAGVLLELANRYPRRRR